MLGRALTFAALLALGAAASWSFGKVSAAPTGPPSLAQRNTGGIPVDVELVLAVDISYSMDPDEQALQREGYIQAILSKEFMQALREGANGKIAITYFEWASTYDRRVIVPWRMIDGPESANAMVSELSKAPYRRAARTSVSGAISFGTDLLDQSPYRGIRRVIDVSGDGANNNGPPVTQERDAALAKGITINGLPVMVKRPSMATMDVEQLDLYYEDCVIGGAGSFVIPIKNREQFITATRTKLVLEIAGRVPEARVVPAAANAPRVNCMIGEKMWQERWGRDNMDWR